LWLFFDVSTVEVLIPFLNKPLAKEYATSDIIPLSVIDIPVPVPAASLKLQYPFNVLIGFRYLTVFHRSVCII